ncbi:MAG: hypothetical protein RMJ56_02535 [Gemmataceae bacterium]|nr:hypothetical protein [Gemmata sp.]MDW8196464.1 hypothetical protein [Gemmataceae bacterium]
MSMFTRDGIQIRYPDHWQLETIDDPESGGWTMTVTSPQTAFFMMSLQPEARDSGDLSDQTLDAMKSEYREFDAEEVMESICGLPAIGFNADFLTLDTPITCRVRCLNTLAGPLMLMAQVSEYDRGENDPALRAIIASLNVDVDE